MLNGTHRTNQKLHMNSCVVVVLFKLQYISIYMLSCFADPNANNIPIVHKPEFSLKM